jgi:hypothetical protein
VEPIAAGGLMVETIVHEEPMVDKIAQLMTPVLKSYSDKYRENKTNPF